jgi:hypothetical protein
MPDLPAGTYTLLNPDYSQNRRAPMKTALHHRLLTLLTKPTLANPLTYQESYEAAILCPG